ncbi:MAG: hypothetical protein ACK40C_13310 [Novosphingobium meiothermophilum]
MVQAVLAYADPNAWGVPNSKNGWNPSFSAIIWVNLAISDAEKWQVFPIFRNGIIWQWREPCGDGDCSLQFSGKAPICASSRHCESKVRLGPSGSGTDLLLPFGQLELA